MSADVRAALWRDLSEAAKRWAANPKAEEGQALSDAAKAWGAAHAPSAETKPKSKHERSGELIPFGRSKGQPIEEADTKDLQWVAGAVKVSIEDPAKERWAPKNRALLLAIEAELETR